MEEKFVRLADLQKFPLRKDHYDKEHGNKHFIYGIETVFEYVDELPKYEIAVQSEGKVSNDVCKALDCCATPTDGEHDPCDECPMYCGESTECITNMCIAALDMIRHQRATIEFLQKTIRENEQRHLEMMIEEYRRAGVDVARVIFKEMEKYMMDSVDVTHTAYKTIGTSTFAILKKKYTEGEE